MVIAFLLVPPYADLFCSIFMVALFLNLVDGIVNSKIECFDLIKQENFDLCSQSRCRGSIQKDCRSG